MLTALLVLVSVVFLDILLSGDNAVVIGMAANTLPEKQRNKAIIFGMALAAVIRIFLSLFARALLQYRFISILGGLGLFWVAYKLGKDILYPDTDTDTDETRKGKTFAETLFLIAMADASMSLDNILAVAALARNNPVILVFGLMISIACVGAGAKITSLLLERWKWLNWVGVVLIVVIAIELIFGIKAI